MSKPVKFYLETIILRIENTVFQDIKKRTDSVKAAKLDVSVPEYQCA